MAQSISQPLLPDPGRAHQQHGGARRSLDTQHSVEVFLLSLAEHQDEDPAVSKLVGTARLAKMIDFVLGYK